MRSGNHLARPAGFLPALLRGLLLVLLMLGLWLTVASPAEGSEPEAQESPYTQQQAPPSDSGGLAILQPLGDLPIWAQAALFSAATGLVFFILIEGVKLTWELWQGSRGGRGR